MLRWGWMARRAPRLSLGAVAALLALVGGCAGEPAVDRGGEPDAGGAVTEQGRYRVIRVVDSDTLVLAYHGKTRVRIIGIDTPEITHPQGRAECGGRQASKGARQLLQGTTVEIAFNPRGDRWDQYDRLLAYITLPDGSDFGEVMLRRGHADLFYAQEHPREHRYRSAKTAAKKAGRGLWGYCR